MRRYTFAEVRAVDLRAFFRASRVGEGRGERSGGEAPLRIGAKVTCSTTRK